MGRWGKWSALRSARALPRDRRLCGPQSRSGHRDYNYMYFYQILERNTLQTITIIHSDINVTALLLGNGDESERRVVYIFLSNDLPNSLLQYFSRDMNHPVKRQIIWLSKQKAVHQRFRRKRVFTWEVLKKRKRSYPWPCFGVFPECFRVSLGKLRYVLWAGFQYWLLCTVTKGLRIRWRAFWRSSATDTY
jgi:hypothetical protein